MPCAERPPSLHLIIPIPPVHAPEAIRGKAQYEEVEDDQGDVQKHGGRPPNWVKSTPIDGTAKQPPAHRGNRLKPDEHGRKLRPMAYFIDE